MKLTISVVTFGLGGKKIERNLLDIEREHGIYLITEGISWMSIDAHEGHTHIYLTRTDADCRINIKVDDDKSTIVEMKPARAE
jgi:hypothetical protein